MTFSAGTVREFKHSRTNKNVYTAHVNENTPKLFWEEKIVIRAATKDEAMSLQRIIVEALNRSYDEQC